MSLWVDILIVTLEFLLMVFMTRLKIRFFFDKKMSKSERRLIRNETNFWNWIFYKKHIRYLPKGYLICYFSHLVIYPILVTIFIILHSLGFLDYNNIDGTIIYSYFLISTIPLFILKA